MPKRFPREKDSASSDNVDGHEAEFIERDLRAVGEIVPDVASQSGVRV